MKNTPFFSIIIPTYNSDATLQKCIDSIVMQSFTDYEVLIIDGVSKDNTLTIASNYINPRIRIYSEPDKGVYDAMNKGVNLAKGYWIYFLGSDDFLYNGNVLYQIYLVAHSTNRMIIYGNVLFNGDVSDYENGAIYDGFFSLKKLLNQNICHQAIFYQRRVFSKIGNFNLNYAIYADWDFNLRCKAKIKFKYCNNIIALFSVNGKSRSQNDENFHSQFLDNIAKYFKWQIYKNDFSLIRMNVLKDQLKKIKVNTSILILIQILLFYPCTIICSIKKRICFR